MARFVARRVTAFAACAALGVVCACRDATEIELDLSTDVPCADVAEATVAVADALPALAGSAPGASTSTCDDAARGGIGSIVLVPSGDKDVAVAIEATLRTARGAACDTPGSACIVARRRITYLPHTRLVVSIALRRVCAGVVCRADETCVEGTCAGANVPDPGSCVGPTACGETTLVDAGQGRAPDGGPEAGDAAGDGPSVGADAGA